MRSVQHLRRLANFLRITLAARACVMHHHAPALWGLVIDIGSQYKCMRTPARCKDFHFFQDVMHGARQGVNPAHLFGTGLYGAAMGKHGLKSCANGTGTYHARPTRVYAGNIIFVRPACHEFFDICTLQGLIKCGFYIVRSAA